MPPGAVDQPSSVSSGTVFSGRISTAGETATARGRAISWRWPRASFQRTTASADEAGPFHALMRAAKTHTPSFSPAARWRRRRSASRNPSCCPRAHEAEPRSAGQCVSFPRGMSGSAAMRTPQRRAVRRLIGNAVDRSPDSGRAAIASIMVRSSYRDTVCRQNVGSVGKTLPPRSPAASATYESRCRT